MSTILDFSAQLVQWDIPDTHLVAMTSVVLCLLGIFGSILVLYTLPFRSSLSPRELLVFSLSVADLQICILTVVFASVHFASSSFSTGIVGCLVYSTFITICCNASLLTLLAMSWERYVTIVHRKEFTVQDARTSLGALWAVALVYALYPFYTKSYPIGVSLSPGKLYCATTFWSSEPIVVAQVYFLNLTIVTTLVVITYTYYRILRLYLARRKRSSSRFTSLQKQLLVRTLTLIAFFFIGWSPTAIAITYEMITHQPVAGTTDHVAALFTALNSVANPFLLIALDPRVRSGVLEMLGLHKLLSRSESQPAPPTTVEHQTSMVAVSIKTQILPNNQRRSVATTS
ncbi:hypothetical protein HDU91_001206 [Kappamyces sp. JEL0680]|nr:hypothetical protein HDU91_001206 [Kappamyces sp. JEL0680]